MNFNELDAYWLVERSACFWVTKPWEATLSCHSKNVLDPFSRYLKGLLLKIYLLEFFFKFAVLATDAHRCLCMSLQNFIKFY